MARLIDADTLLETSDVFILHTKEYGSIDVISVDAVGDAHTVDAVEVVRCKDCRYWQYNNGGYPNEECRWREDETPDADDFCSYGKRKDGDDK